MAKADIMVKEEHKVEEAAAGFLNEIIDEERKEGWLPESISCVSAKDKYSEPMCYILFRRKNRQ